MSTRFLTSPQKMKGTIHNHARASRDERIAEERAQKQIDEDHLRQRAAILAGMDKHQRRNPGKRKPA